MPSGKRAEKQENHKKPANKQGYSTASWEERLADKREEEDDGEITDPELIAEKEYALEHGLVAGGGLSMVAAAGASEPNRAKKETLINAKVKQAKADRKARGRGVSGSMCKKDKAIACGGFHTLMDMDVYYGLEDEYGNCISDTEEPFEGHEDGYEGSSYKGKQGQAEAPKVDLINGDMNKMSFDDEDQDDDRPGPSRPRPGASGTGKPKRLYRL